MEQWHLLVDHRGESEVRNLDAVVGVEKDVLRLQVSVVHIHGVAVGDGLSHLYEVLFGRRLVELTALGDAVKELTSAAQLLGVAGERGRGCVVGGCEARRSCGGAGVEAGGASP